VSNTPSPVPTAPSPSSIRKSFPNIHNKSLSLRTSTERQEAVDAGFAELVGVKPKKVLAAVNNWWSKGANVPNRKSPFGEGKAAERSIARMNAAGYC